MKNKRKFLVLIIALLMMCLCFTGCTQLDEMREEQAVWTTKGSTDSITYKGVEYKKLYDPDHYADPLYNQELTSDVFVTQPDVPVLLSNKYGEQLNMSDDESFITGSMFEADTNSCNTVLFCKADMYNDIASKMKSDIEYTKYGFSYYRWDEEKDDYVYDYYYLTEEETDAVNKVLDKVEPVPNSILSYSSEAYLCQLNEVSDDKLFGKYGYELYKDRQGTYYILDPAEFIEDRVSYEVPKELAPIFESIENLATGNSSGAQL